MDKAKIGKKIKTIFKENNFRFKDDEFLKTNVFKNENVDSFQLMSIISDIEKKFKFKISDKFLQELNKKNTQKVIDLIYKKIK
tara:strand:+ start:420 stop:668 length:249 start_codon:yes stop_codon:yes gene_type:complete